MNRFEIVRNKFIANSIKPDNEWLSECVRYYSTESSISLSISNDELYEKAYEQWLLADLNEIGIECLPEMVVNKKEEFTLTGNFALQLNYILDISESAYDQLRHLYNKKLDEPEVEPTQEFKVPVKKKRVLRLNLTDGKKSVEGMEYRPIACLNTKLTPGCKVLLKGPIKCVNKVLFLCPANIEILGGEVDILLIENAYENILLKQLGKPINPKPITNYVEASVVEEREKPKSNITYKPAVFDKIPAKSNNKAIKIDLTPEDDELLMKINFDEIAVQAAQVGIKKKKSFSTARSEPNKNIPYTDHYENDDFNDIDIIEALEKENIDYNIDVSVSRPSSSEIYQQPEQDRGNTESSSVVQSSHIAEQTTRKFSIDDDDFLVSSLLFDDSSFQLEEKKVPSILDKNYEFKIRGCSLVTIDQLYEHTDDEKRDRLFMIYAEIDGVAEKLKISNNEWTVGVLLSDKSEHVLQVRFSSSVIDKLADGHTAREMTEMRRMASKQPQIKNEMISILDNLKTKMQQVHCFMKVDFSNQPYPIVIELIDSAPFLITILNNKLTKENIKC